MQASKIELGQTYAAQGFDFRATGIITIKRNKSTTNYIEGIQIRPDPGEQIIEVKVEVKDIIDTVEQRDRLHREAVAAEAARNAEKQAKDDRRAKAARLLAEAIGVQFDGKRDWKLKGPKVSPDHSGVEVSEEALDALIRYLEAK